MKIFSFLCASLLALSVHAENVILMVGDGMGFNHLACTDYDFVMKKLPVLGSIRTKPVDAEITDSSAAATAYACGQKTNNKYVAVLPNGKNCKTIAEQAQEKGYYVGILSDDIETGATPSCFYAHTKNRRDADGIKPQLEAAKKKMDIRVAVPDILSETQDMLAQAEQSGRPFFLMIEGGNIDVESHKHNMDLMKDKLKNFDKTVSLVYDFVNKRDDTILVVLADHETGGLTEACEFTSYKHTGVDVPLFVAGPKSELFSGAQENAEVGQKIRQILLSKKGK